MNKVFLYFIFFVFSSFEGFGQVTQLFDVLDSDDNNYEINWSQKIKLLSDSNKVLLLGIIVDPSLYNNDFERTGRIDETWLSFFKLNKFLAEFIVAHPKNAAKDFKLIFNNKIEVPLQRSTLFIVVKNPQIISFLKSNSDYLSINVCKDCNIDKSIQSKSTEIFQLINVANSNDYEWKTNQLIYNLNCFEPKKSETKAVYFQHNFFQLGTSTSLITSNNKVFDNFSTRQIDLNLLLTPKKAVENFSSKTNFGIGLSYCNNQFSSTEDNLYSSVNIGPLDTTYAKLNGIKLNYQQELITLKGLIGFKLKANENFIGLNFSPFYAVYDKLYSSISSGSITTFGKKNGIDEYLYNIEELGLNSNLNSLIGQKRTFNTSTYGLVLGINYQIKLKTCWVNPNININLFSLVNKDELLDSYDFMTATYRGFFVTQHRTNFICPTFGISILF